MSIIAWTPPARQLAHRGVLGLAPDLEKYIDIVPAAPPFPATQQFFGETHADIDAIDLQAGKLILAPAPFVVGNNPAKTTLSYLVVGRTAAEQSAFDEIKNRPSSCVQNQASCTWVLINVADAASTTTGATYRVVETDDPAVVVTLAGVGGDWAIYDPVRVAMPAPGSSAPTEASALGGSTWAILGAIALGGLLLLASRAK